MNNVFAGNKRNKKLKLNRVFLSGCWKQIRSGHEIETKRPHCHWCLHGGYSHFIELVYRVYRVLQSHGKVFSAVEA